MRLRFFKRIKVQWQFHRKFQDALKLSKQGEKRKAFAHFKLLLQERPFDVTVGRQLLNLGEEFDEAVDLSSTSNK